MKLGWKSALIFAPIILAVAFGVVIFNQDISFIMGTISMILLAVWGAALSRYAYLEYKKELRDQEWNYSTYIQKLMEKTVWRSSFIHMPGLNDQIAGQLRTLAHKCPPEKTQEAFEKLFYLRMQHDMDHCSARLVVSEYDDFIIDHWLETPEKLDTNGMNAICHAVSSLDISMVKKMIAAGERLDIQIRPYKMKYMNNLLTLAHNARNAAVDLAEKLDIEIDKAREMLEEKRLEMFTFLLNSNPRIWIDTKYDSIQLGLYSCLGDPRFEQVFNSFSKRVRLEGITGGRESDEEVKPIL